MWHFWTSHPPRKKVSLENIKWNDWVVYMERPEKRSICDSKVWISCSSLERFCGSSEAVPRHQSIHVISCPTMQMGGSQHYFWFSEFFAVSDFQQLRLPMRNEPQKDIACYEMDLLCIFSGTISPPQNENHSTNGQRQHFRGKWGNRLFTTSEPLCYFLEKIGQLAQQKCFRDFHIVLHTCIHIVVTWLVNVFLYICPYEPYTVYRCGLFDAFLAGPKNYRTGSVTGIRNPALQPQQKCFRASNSHSSEA
jgi:hypothetical protein